MKALGLLVAAVAGAVGFAALEARGSTPTDVYLTLTLQVDPVAQTWQAFGQVTGDTTQTSGLAGLQFNVTGAGGAQIGTGGVDTTNNDTPVGATGSFPIGFYNQNSPGTFGVGITGAQPTYLYQTKGGQNNVLTGAGVVGQTQFGVTWGLPVLLADGTYTGTTGSLTIWGAPTVTIFLPASLPAPTAAGVGVQTFSPVIVNTQTVQIPNTSFTSTAITWTGASGGSWDTTQENWSSTSAGLFNAPWSNNLGVASLHMAAISPAGAGFISAPNTATFGLGQPATIAVDDNITVGSISFKTAGWTLAPGTGALAYGPSGTMNIGAVSDTINAIIADGSTFGSGGGVTSLATAGYLTLGGANTYSGGTTFVNGTIGAGNNAAFGTGAITVAANTSLFAAGADHTLANPILINAGQTLTIADDPKGTHKLTLTGPISGDGALTLAGAGALILAGSNTYSGSTTLNRGTLGGYGTVAGAVIAGSGSPIIYPSATLSATSTGTLTVGTLSTNASTTLAFNLVTPGSSSANDVIKVTGNNGLTLDGNAVEFPNYSTGAPSLGYYKIIEYVGSIQGLGIKSLTMTGIGSNVSYILDTTHDPGFVDVHRGLLGDANDDGAVDSADLVLLSNHLGVYNAGWGGGDFNNDGVTNFADFVILSNDFGGTIGANDVAAGGAVSGVPEPASLALLGAGLAGLFGRQRRRDSGGKV